MRVSERSSERLALSSTFEPANQYSVPLLVAIKYGHRALVDFLLDEKADPNVYANSGEHTSMHQAAISMPDILARLIELKGDPNTARDGTTPLHWYCFRHCHCWCHCWCFD